MIYALISGTYAPIALIVLHPGWRAPILATVWGGAFVAAVAKFVWHDAPSGSPRRRASRSAGSR